MNCRPAILFVVCLSGLWCCRIPCVLADEPNAIELTQDLDDRIRQLIEQLGDSSFYERSNARWELERIGLQAFEQLRAAVNHPDIQVAESANYLLLSQRVTWWLDTDSMDVRRRLMDYNALNEDDRQTCLEALAEIGTDDALLSLGRVAKFESNERLSRFASLILLDKMSELPQSSRVALARSVQLTIAPADREGTRWLTVFSKHAVDGTPADIDAWRQFALEFHASTSESGDAKDKLHVLQFYQWLADWGTTQWGREAALELIEPALGFVAPNAYSVHEFCTWALAGGLPELTVWIAEQQPAFFEKEPKLVYLLAEAQLRLGKNELAEETARGASALLSKRSEELRLLIRSNAGNLLAQQRSRLAFELAARGLFDWAESEYLAALELEIGLGIEAGVRMALAELYWSGGENQKAADVLEKLIKVEKPSAALPAQVFDPDSFEIERVESFYYFYLGLAASERGEKLVALEHFRKAAESFDNPDIVIAIKQLGDEEPIHGYFQEQFDAMVAEFRASVATAEALLAEATPDRNSHQVIANELAMACNQLAWLLSKCEMNTEEAIQLSQRSLEYFPDRPAYLDTMARCCFAVGRFEDAVEYQLRAVELSPEDRQMKVQLEEFQERLAREDNPGKQ